MAKRIQTIRKKRGVHQLMFLLSILYLGSTSYPALLHSVVHSHETAVAHSGDQERDPCHRSIYHHDRQSGCDHDSHLIVSDKCKMCDLAFHGDQTIVPHIEISSGKFDVEYFDSYKQNLAAYRAVISSSRAPPTHV